MVENNYLISDLAEQAGVAENTARRYARLFEVFFRPKQYGRITKYPREAAQTLSRISDLYKEGLSTPEIVERLRAETGQRPTGPLLLPDFEPSEPQGGFDDSRSHRLDRIDQTLEQLLPKLQNALESAEGERRRDRERIRALEEELREALVQREALLTRLTELELDLDRRLARLEEAVGPESELMGLPLVFRSEKGEFLGVSDKARKHFSLNDFLSLIETNKNGGRVLAMNWQTCEGGRWMLSITENPGDAENERTHCMVIHGVQTPRKNRVALIERLSFDGRDMPVFFLYELFKQIGKGFAKRSGGKPF